jgi:hypothetical protein
MNKAAEDPAHSIVDQPSTYRVTDFCYHRTLDDSTEAYIDLTLQRGDTIRRLRFYSPQSVSLEDGFPEGCGLYIADVRHRKLEGLGVRVDDYEGSGGAIRFWARTVSDLDESAGT